MKKFPNYYFLSILFVIFILASTKNALAWSLSGTVSDEDNGHPSTVVTLINATNSLEMDSTVTDSAGYYQFSNLENGTYSLRITASGYEESTVNGIIVENDDVLQNVVLLLPAVTVNLTGAVYAGSENVPIDGVEIDVYIQGTYTIVWQGQTDATGVYTAPVEPGKTYRVIMELRNANSSVETPFMIGWTAAENVVVDDDITLPDIFLPLVTISGQTVDYNGVPVGGVYVTRQTYSNSMYRLDNSESTTSDDNGNYSMVVVSGSGYTFVLTPPDSSGLAVTTVGDVDVITDTTLDLQLISATTISGAVYSNTTAKPISGIIVKVFNQSKTQQIWYGYTDDNGRYKAPVPPGGIYHIFMMTENYRTNIETPNANWYAATDLNVTEDVVLPDEILPIVTISGHTRDPEGNILTNTLVTLLQWSNNKYTVYQNTNQQINYTMYQNGMYSFPVIAGTGYSFQVKPPTDDRHLVNTAIDGIDIPIDTNRDLVARVGTRLYGSIYGPDDVTPAFPVIVSVVNLRTGQWTGITTNGAEYNLYVMPGDTYRIEMRTSYGDYNLIPTRLSWTPFTNVYVNEETALPDIILPLRLLSGFVTDKNGVPISGVPLKLGDWNDGYYSLQDRLKATSGNGYYSFGVISGDNYMCSVFPPDGSGFSDVFVSGIDISEDTLQNYILTMPDIHSPLVLSGPVVSAITDTSAVITWQTDEQALGGARFGDSSPPLSSIAETEYVTHHSLTLDNLTPDSTYFVNVFASDSSGNGPAESKVISFTTKVSPDTRPPTIISGPIVTAIDHDSATIEWNTNEPATGHVFYGISELLEMNMNDGTLSIDHKMTLTNLSPETVYYFQVDATDAEGNGSVLNSILTFNTLEAPDTSTPIIVEGPMAINISSNEATIIWTTDEPATSGVSYNDGTAYGVYTDEDFVTSHSVHLENLSPATLYTFTVSTNDEMGNGPTLGDTKQFTTLDILDSQCPVIVEYPVKHVNHQQAIINWRTDEPASSIIEYGLTVDALTELESRSALTQPHNLTLTGLEPGSTYYFRIISEDTFGNSCTSQIWDFTTDPAPNSNSPKVTKGPETVYSGDDTLTVTWETDEPTSTVLEYNESGEVVKRQSKNEVTKTHQVTIKGLTPGTDYKVAVAATDVEGNTTFAKLGYQPVRIAFSGDWGQFIPSVTASTTATSDATIPSITEPPSLVGISDTTATIRWKTDEIADSVIRYGLNGGELDQHIGDIVDTATHTLVLTNLVPGTTYDFVVESIDPSANGPVISSSSSFTTLSEPDSTGPVFTLAPAATSYSPSQAEIEWSTNEAASTVLRYGRESGNLDYAISSNGLNLEHYILLTNLLSGTTYYFIAEATDSSGNTSVSAEGSITTLGTPPSDADQDWVPDEQDNCPRISNLAQSDSDQDGWGDVCDPAKVCDFNFDGEVNLEDAILSLQILTGTDPSEMIFPAAALNESGEIGLKDTIHVLNTLTE